MEESLTKFDEGKLEWHLIPTEAMEEVVKVYMVGKLKYSENNWRKGGKYSKLYNSAMRHLQDWWKGENKDEESKCHHLSAVVFACLGLMTWQATDKGEDDRGAGIQTWAEKLVGDLFEDVKIDKSEITLADAVQIKNTCQGCGRKFEANSAHSLYYCSVKCMEEDE